jgi:hypothetical protein
VKFASPVFAQTKGAGPSTAKVEAAKLPESKLVNPVSSKATAAELREIRDLKAQEDMANWAFWMLIASTVGSLLTIVGLVFVWKTLHHTRRAADSAGDSVTDSRKAAANQLRAYVGPRAVNYTFDLSGGFGVGIEITNFGQTPAFRFRHIAGINYLPYPLGELPEIGKPIGVPHTLYPTQNTYVNLSLPMLHDRIKELRGATGCFFLTLIIEYFDHQGQQNLTCHRLYTTNNLGAAVWHETHQGTMTFHSDQELVAE